jgi:propanediol utilization protein
LLGIEVPLRESGNLDGSPGAVPVGPAGELVIAQG